MSSSTHKYCKGFQYFGPKDSKTSGIVGSAREYSTLLLSVALVLSSTVCPGSSDPPEKIFNIFASEWGLHPLLTITIL